MNDDRFSKLWTDFLEGDLNEEGLAELRQMFQQDERLLEAAADSYQIHRLLGMAACDQRAFSEVFVQATMERLPADSGQFTGAVMQRLRASAENRSRQRISPWRLTTWVVVSVAALAMGVWLLTGALRQADAPAPPGLGPLAESADVEVRLAASSRARFFGELAPRLHAVLESQREYVLTEGLVELAFPSGASVIIESPAVFRVLSETSLAVDTGRCSVYAPEGAEGFHIETPVTRIVDRGTRFAVSVSETNETEVQVLEGIADVYRRDIANSAQGAIAAAGQAQPTEISETPETRLVEREARRFTAFGGDAASPLTYTPGAYRHGLPDRVIRYEAATDAHGNALRLQSITVQRGGKVVTYPFEQLIPVELTWFKSADTVDPSGHVVGGEQLPDSLGDLLSDGVLNSGVINPGGSLEPLSTDPVMEIPEDAGRPGTPGFAVRFRSPVVNGPGPDVVFMELQTYTNPLNGDAFHVSPLEFQPGRRSLTIRHYDLTMTSPEAQRLAGFSLYRYAQPIASLEELRSAEHVRGVPGARFHGLAVAIDLSDLGFAEGEQVEGLFFQDADDDSHRVDPVFIGGLPEP